MRKTLMLVIAFITIIGCEKENNDDLIRKTKKKLLGEWVEVYPCDSCHSYSFYENDSMDIKIIGGDSYLRYAYSVITRDSLHIEKEPDLGNHRIHFYSDDSIKIDKLYLSITHVGSPDNFVDVTLIKK
ncbi:MAG: hypothetical protein K9H49_14910 [Bacteroidales bacterium]|nr:hypothetical protein [Saprospiraceae bacterium]MCF8380861.1 hypothetical protein [Bacteroidales bacterium]